MIPITKILCVDDHADSCEVTALLLQRSVDNCVVVGAGNTDVALGLIASEKFDLYILDTWMPEIGGLHLCKRIRETDQATPIVFLTAMTSRANMRKVFAMGGNAFLTKPDGLARLVSTVSGLLRKSQAASNEV
jgi:DNA-binding response OmpR family regulator